MDAKIKRLEERITVLEEIVESVKEDSRDCNHFADDFKQLSNGEYVCVRCKYITDKRPEPYPGDCILF